MEELDFILEIIFCVMAGACSGLSTSKVIKSVLMSGRQTSLAGVSMISVFSSLFRNDFFIIGLGVDLSGTGVLFKDFLAFGKT